MQPGAAAAVSRGLALTLLALALDSASIRVR